MYFYTHVYIYIYIYIYLYIFTEFAFPDLFKHIYKELIHSCMYTKIVTCKTAPQSRDLQESVTESWLARKRHKVVTCKKASQSRDLQESVTESWLARKRHKVVTCKKASQSRDLQENVISWHVAKLIIWRDFLHTHTHTSIHTCVLYTRAHIYLLLLIDRPDLPKGSLVEILQSLILEREIFYTHTHTLIYTYILYTIPFTFHRQARLARKGR
jgi:hypothetical protein